MEINNTKGARYFVRTSYSIFKRPVYYVVKEEVVYVTQDIQQADAEVKLLNALNRKEQK